MEITAQMVKDLRAATGAGVMDCRKALEATDGDTVMATEVLKEKALASAATLEPTLALNIDITSHIFF